MSERQKVSLYIPCYNGEEYIASCIEGVLSQFRKPDEIFVIDDGSTDRTAEIAENYPQVTVIRHEENKGLAAARNSAIAASTGDYVASLDADCVADKLWLYTLLQVMKTMPETVGGIGGKLIEAFQNTPADAFRAHFMCQHKGDEPVLNPGFVAGANTMFRRNALFAVGGYHEAFKTNGEDVQVCRKMQQMVFTVVYEPRATVQHQRQDSIASVVRMNWAHWRHPMAIIDPVTTLRRAVKRAWMRISYCTQMIRAIWRAKEWRFLKIGFRCLVVTPFWEIREWWRIKRNDLSEQYEQRAKAAMTFRPVSPDDPHSLVEPLSQNS
ncbi:MAG: glycosyltransferase family 2 protein [Pseudomonadota bacterium]|nr:glycosyltransferase family 2 protein [Pseudomonadota bacterium]